MINEKFGLGTMTTADQAPEPDSSILRRLFEDFKKRRGFAEGSPNPMEEMATLKQAYAAELLEAKTAVEAAKAAKAAQDAVASDNNEPDETNNQIFHLQSHY